MPKLFRDPREGRTLVLCPPDVGCFVRATPLLKILSETLGPERLSLFTPRADLGSIARASGLFRRVYARDPDRDGWVRGARLLAAVRNERFTHSLALFPSSHWKFSLFHRLAGAAFRTGFRYPHQFLPEWVQHHSLPLARLHDTPQNLRFAEVFLREAPESPVEPFLPFEPRRPGALPAGPFFACHPGAGESEEWGAGAGRGAAQKRLPPETFAALIRRVHGETGWPCVLVGGPEEHAVRAAVAMDCRECLAAVPTRSLEETAGVLGAARFFLGNDSGLMHLAAAAGTRCAAWFGPTDEARTGPYGHWLETDGAPRHLILRRPGSEPLWTIDTIGANPPVDRADAAARWGLDPARAWPALRDWIAAL